MKIVIASEGKNEDSKISSRGARAPFYLVFDNGKLKEVIKNPFAIGSGGAGWSVAHMLADKKIELVIAEKIGSNMEIALKEKKINFKEFSGNVKDFMKG
jgi:predicted Fe-Mo cluster-binding NifX family protein